MSGQQRPEPLPEPVSDSHFALMDKVYRRQRHIYDFTRKYYLVGRDRLIRQLDLKPGERVVEIGCGTARNLIKIAKLYPHAELYGLDASAEMLASAAIAVERGGFSSRIHLARGLAEEIAPAMFGLAAPFDRVIFSYSLSMIPDWRGAMRRSREVLAPAGCAHVVDFGDLGGLNPFIASGLRRWLRIFHVTPRTELLAGVEAATDSALGGNLTVLSGRYAFLWHGTRDSLGRAAGPVALTPQVGENSP